MENLIIDNTLLYILILIIVCLILLLISLTFFYLKQVARYLKLKEEKEVKEKVANKPIVDAQQKANQIVADAVKKSEEILASTKSVSAASEEKLNDKLREATQSYADVYGQAMEVLRGNVIRMIGNTPNDIKNQVAQEVKTFRAKMQEQLGISQQIINQKLEQGYQGANEEIERYKKARARKIDESILKIIEHVSKKVLEKEIRIEERRCNILWGVTKWRGGRQKTYQRAEGRRLRTEDRLGRQKTEGGVLNEISVF